MIHRFAEVELDTDAFELRVRAEAVALTAKPFGVLLYLVQRPGRVVSREELLGAVWPDTTVSESSLTQCIYQLRQLLPRLPDGRPLIETMYGRGYRLCAQPASDSAGSAVDPSRMPRAVTDVESRVDGFGERPAIAVLPFESSGDSAASHFGDGVAEDLIDRLASYRLVPVIAKSSSFRYRPPLDVRLVGRELGVRYAIEGLVQHDGQRVRVTASLLDAESARVVSRQSHEGRIGELFEFQEEVAANLFGVLEPDLRRYEIRRALRTDARDLAAWGMFMRGSWHLFRYTREDNAKARELFAEARAKDATFAPPLAFTSLSHLNDVNAGWTDNARRSLALALADAEKSVALDASDPWSQAMLGGIYAVLGRRAPAIASLEAALAANPSFPVALWALGRGLSVWGRAREAVDLFHRAIRLSPHDPLLAHFLEGLGFAHYFLGEDDEAASYAEQSLRARSDWPRTHLLLAAALAQLGQLEAAGRELGRYQRLRGPVDAEQLRASYKLADAEPGLCERLLDGLALSANHSFTA